MIMRKLPGAILLFFPVFIFSQNKEGIKVTDMLKIKAINGVTLNNDGSRALFTVTSIEPDGDSKLEYKYVNQVWEVATDGRSRPRPLTSKENSSQPVWSPDGRQFAFVRQAENKPQIFLLSLDGGEAIQLTHFRYGAGNPKWSPDGKQLIFSSGLGLKDLLKDSLLNPAHSRPSWSFEKAGFNNNENLDVFTNNTKADPDGSIAEIRAYLDNDVTDKKARVVNRLNFQDEMDVNPDIPFTHFFLVNVSTPNNVTDLTKGFYRFGSADFTPSGKEVILSGDVDSTDNPDRSLESEIFLENTDGSNLHMILGEKDASYNSPKISPSGKWLAYLHGPTSFLSVPVLEIVAMDGNMKNRIEIPFDRSKGNLTWSADERYIYFLAQSNGGAPLYRVDISSKKIEALSGYDNGVTSYDFAGNKIVFVKTEVADPFELYLADMQGKNAVRISDFNYSWAQSKQLSFPEKKSFVNELGETIEYWIMKPINYVQGKKFPLLLEIHGGPSAMWGPGETSMWHEFQYFCSRGYGVVYCNPRGSGGYGLNFLRANVNDWGTGPTRDVLTALDKTVAEGWADTSRLLVTGGSYAGYLVAWIIAHDHRFKAACSQRGVYDLATFFGEGNAWRLVPNYFGGYPWETQTRAILERESPINYVQQITTPYIIFHGDNDRRTGFVQSEMMYRSLKALNRPVEYVRHPGGTHELTRSGNNRQRIDQMLRTYEFFERYIH
jgi:dipeptidyl aminopeptidase/acylaminoacyl peptidase